MNSRLKSSISGFKIQSSPNTTDKKHRQKYEIRTELRAFALLNTSFIAEIKTPPYTCPSSLYVN
jgi:hypothetical protein